MERKIIEGAAELLVKILRPVIGEEVRSALDEQNEKKRVYPETLTVGMACEISGYSRNTLYQLHSNGKIPCAKKIGGKLVFNRDEFRAWIQERTSK